MELTDFTETEANVYDMYGFRVWKIFIRKFSDLVKSEELKIDLFHRDNIFKIQYITHHQFSSPRYVNTRYVEIFVVRMLIYRKTSWIFRQSR